MNAECGMRSAELTPVQCGCGGESVIDYLIGEPSEGNSYCVYCKVCEIHTGYYDTEAEAIEAWNKAIGGNVQDCAKYARCSDPDDLISRQDVLSKLNFLCEICGKYKIYNGTLKDAITIVEEIPSAEPERKFIPFEIALPNDRQKVLCVNKRGEMMVGGYLTNYGMTFPCYFEKPVAWMPLPEPYKEGD